jgi:adenylate cyclase
MADIFISYSSTDRSQAEQLAELLTSAGLSVWIDRQGIDAATSWSGEIVDAIDGCKVLTVLLSPSSVASKNVAREVALAFEKNKKILPLDLEPNELTRDLQYHLAGIQRAPMTNIDGIIRALGRLGLSSTTAPTAPEVVRTKSTKTSIMILPFEDLSPTADNGWFTDGMASELIGALSRISSLRVIDWNTSRLFRERKIKTIDLARELEVRYFVEGQVRKFGDKLKIFITLLDIETGDHLWQDSLSGTMDQVFEIQEDVARRVIEGSKVHLEPVEQSALTKRATNSPEAYELVLRANSYYRQNTRESLKLSIELLSTALTLDPQYVTAMSSKAMVLGVLYRNFDREPSHLREAEGLLEQALRIEPTSVRTRSLLTLIYSLQGRRDEAERIVLACAAEAPNSSAIQFDLGFFYAEHRPDLAVKAYEKAIELNPESLTTYLNLIHCYSKLHDHEKARYWAMATLPVIEKQMRLAPDDLDLRIRYAAQLELAKGSEAARQALEPLRHRDDFDAMGWYEMASLLGRLGDKVAALSALIRSIEKGFSNLEWIRNDPDLQLLKDEPGFQAIFAAKDAN